MDLKWDGWSGTLCSAMAYGLAVCGAKVAIIGRNTEKLASVSEKLTKDALDEYNKDVTIKGYSCNVINKDELTAAYETIKNDVGDLLPLLAVLKELKQQGQLPENKKINLSKKLKKIKKHKRQNAKKSSKNKKKQKIKRKKS